MSSLEKKTVSQATDLVQRHLVFGWILLLLFLTLGIALEAMHGFKVRWYLDVNNETRRLMWTLAHAHGVLFGLLHIAFGVTVHLRPSAFAESRLASMCLLSGTVLVPGGFFLGGLFIYQGDPGVGVFLTPVGALLLLAAVVATLRSLYRA